MRCPGVRNCYIIEKAKDSLFIEVPSVQCPACRGPTTHNSVHVIVVLPAGMCLVSS